MSWLWQITRALCLLCLAVAGFFLWQVMTETTDVGPRVVAAVFLGLLLWVAYLLRKRPDG